MASKTVKTSDGKTRTVLVGSKADKKYSSQPGTTTLGATESRVAKDASIARTSARSSADPLTVAENAGATIPKRIEAGGIPQATDTALQGLADKNPEAADGAMNKLGYGSTPQVPFDQALKSIQNSGLSSTDIANATNSLKQKYGQGLAQTEASGVAVPPTMGGANQQIQSTLPPPAPDTSAVDLALAEDKGWQALGEQYTEFFSPENQKSSLLDTYNKLYKKSGLDELDEEIIDAQTIIDGTEDDIRNEIEMAGGFGTDSQVQALALSRNKVLLKNYNNLVALRESKATQLDSMMDMADKDRTYADSQFDRMLKYQTQMLDYRDKFIQNARDQYNKYDATTLYSMLSENPRQLAFAEQIMGLGAGGLERLAGAPLGRKEQLELDLLESQLQNAELERANIRADIKTKSSTVPEESKEIQRKADAVVLAKELLSDSAVGKKSAVGGSLAKIVPFGKTLGLQGNRSAFESKVATLKANLTLDNLKLLKGAMSDKDLMFLQSVGSSLNTSMSEENFNKELRKIIRKLDPSDPTGQEGEVAGASTQTIDTQNLSKAKVSGLTVDIPGVGKWTAPNLETLNKFLKDNNL